MPVTKTWAGGTFNLPLNREPKGSWGTEVSNFLISLANNALALTGGTQTLSAELNFGATYGLVSAYVKSASANIASSGMLRLAKGDSVAWRNNANGADLALGVNASDRLTFGGVAIPTISSTDALTAKTIVVASNTVTTAASGNLAATELNAALTELQSDIDTRATSATVTAHTGASSGVHGVTGSVVGTTDTQTLTNKTLSTGTVVTAGKITTAVAEVDPADNTKQWNADLSTSTTGTSTTFKMAQTANRTLTFPDATDTLVGKATTDTLTNKTLTSPVIGTIVNTGTLTLPTSTDTLVARATTDTLTNKTLTSPTINGGTHTGVTSLGIRDTSAAFDITHAHTSSTALTAGRTLTFDVANVSSTLKTVPLANFSTLADGSAGQVLTTLGSGTGYQWAAGLTTTLNQYNTLIGNASNVATPTNTSLLGSIVGQTASQTATITIATPGVLTVTTAPATGATVYLTTSGALPTGLTASTTYYAINVAGTTFKLATSLGNALAGTAIATSGTQSGTHTLVTGGLAVGSSGLPGNTTGTTTATGYVGEYVVVTGGGNFTTNASVANGSTTFSHKSTSFPAGVWLVGGAVQVNPSGNLGTTSLSYLACSLSTTSDNTTDTGSAATAFLTAMTNAQTATVNSSMRVVYSDGTAAVRFIVANVSGQTINFSNPVMFRIRIA